MKVCLKLDLCKILRKLKLGLIGKLKCIKMVLLFWINRREDR